MYIRHKNKNSTLMDSGASGHVSLRHGYKDLERSCVCEHLDSVRCNYSIFIIFEGEVVWW
jgi:hypothetical protein